MKEFEHGGNVYGKIDQAAGFSQWLDFSANINPEGLSADVRKSILENMDKIIHYPDPKAGKLKEAISRYYSVPEDKIVLGNGAVELLYLYMHLRTPKTVQIPVPSFSEYERAARSAKAEVIYTYLDEKRGFNVDVDTVISRVKDADLLMLCNPNNPTGCLMKRDDVEQMIAAAGDCGADVIVDESFMDFRHDSKAYSVIPLLDRYPNLMVLQSLTKFYAIPGLRLGFALCNEKLAQQLESSKDPWNVNLLAQAAGAAGLKDVEYQRRSRHVVNENMLELAADLQMLHGVKVYSPTVNFILLNIGKTGISSGKLTARMRKLGVLIRDCSNYPGLDENYIRVAVKGKDDNKRLVEALKRCIP